MSSDSGLSAVLYNYGRVGLILAGVPLVWFGLLGFIFPGAEMMRYSEGTEPRVMSIEPRWFAPAKCCLLSIYGVMLIVDPKSFAGSQGLRTLLFGAPVILAALIYWIPIEHTGWSTWAQDPSLGVALLGFLGIIVLYSCPAIFSTCLGFMQPK